MKKIYIFALVFTLCLLSAACGKKAVSPSSSEEASQETASQAQESKTQDTTEAETKTTQGDDDNTGAKNEFNILQGTVVKGSSASDAVTIQTSDGVNLTFDVEEVGELLTTSELAPGKEVALAFQGEYNGRNLDGLKLLLLLDDQPTWEIRIAQGITVYNMMSSFGLRTESGEEVTFIKDGSGQDPDALSKDSGDSVIVTYVSAKNGENYPLYIYRGEEPPVESAQDAE